MLRSAAGTVMWEDHGVLMGLAVILVLASMAFGANGQNFIDRAVAGCVFQATLVNGSDGGEIAVYPNSAMLTRLAVITTRDGESFAKRH